MPEGYTPASSHSFATVCISPPEIVQRQMITQSGFATERVQIAKKERFEYAARIPFHLLIAAERAERVDGETFLEGLPSSRLHDYSGKMTFVPAGHHYRGWNEPRASLHVTYFYIDPNGPMVDRDHSFSEAELMPRLFFNDSALWQTSLKLKSAIESPHSSNRLYVEALSVVLTHEVLRLHNGAQPRETVSRGGLAAWQQKRVAEYIEEHLDEQISLMTLADLAQLSPYHFSRAFKQSFGMPPHRYHKSRRIEHAKALLAKRTLSVTEIALDVGFSETSSFTTAFRQVTGQTPTYYRRSLV